MIEALVKSYDETWVGWPFWIASAIEVDLGSCVPQLPRLEEIAANRSQLCVSIPAIRLLLTIYLPQLLVSRRPPIRKLKEVYDSNEVSDIPSYPAKLQIPEKNASGCISDEQRID